MGKVGQIIGGVVLTVGGGIVGITTGQWGLAFAISAQGVGMIYNALQGARNLNEKQGAVLENRTGAREALPVIYGQTRVGSIFADIRVDAGSQNRKRLVLVCAFAHGSQDGTGVESVDEIYLDDRLAWTDAGGVQAPFNTAIDDDEDIHQSDHLRVIVHLGSDSQAVDSQLNSIFPGPAAWPTTSRGRSVCYAVLMLWYNPDIFGANIPRVNAVITGQKVFDPRTSTTAWSANPLLVLRDYLTAPIYGFGEDAADIDDIVLEASADYADELVTPVSGGSTQKRFLCNGALLTSQALRNNLSDLATSCRGMVVNVGGIWRTFIRRQQSATGLSITPSNVVEGSWKYITPGSSDIPNAVMVNYVDPERDYQTDTVRWPEVDQSNPFLAEDGDYTHVVTMDLPFTDDRLRAQQIGMVVVREQREGIAVILTAKEELLQAEIGDVVFITHPSPNWTDKPFWVLATNYHLEGTIDLVLVEYEPSVYDLSEQFPQPTIPDTGLPDPFSVAAPTGLTLTAEDPQSILGQDGVRVIRIKVEWTRPVEPFLVSYEIQAKRDTEGDDEWDSYGPAGESDLLFYVSPISNEAWDVQIRAVNSLGLHSVWVQDTITPDVTPSIMSAAQQEVAADIARYRLHETDQTLPLGLWGITLEDDKLRIQKNTAVAGDFATFNEFFSMAADGTLTLAIPTVIVESTAAASVGYKATRTAGASVALYAKATVGQVGTITNHALQFLQNSGVVGEVTTAGVFAWVGAITASGMTIESGSPILTLKDTNNVLGDVAYQSYIRGTDSGGAQAWWLGDGQSGVKQASFWATTGYKLGLYSNDTLVLMLSDSSTLATFSGAVSMGALTATTGTFSSYLQGTTGNGYLDLRGDSGAASGLRIDDSGNVLIGTTTDAGFKLDVNGTARTGALTASGIVHAQGGKLEVGTAASGGLNNLQLWDAGAYFRIQSFEGLPLVINSLGNNVLIGTTTDAGFKLDVNGTGRVSGDFTIGSLGIFDSSGAPNTSDVLRYNGSKWVPVAFQTTFAAGDVATGDLGDGTFASYVHDGRGLSGAPTPNPTTAPVVSATYKAMLIDMSAYSLGATEAFVVDYSIDGGGYTTSAIITTGATFIHSGLEIGSTYAYKYKIRGGSDTSYSSASSALAPSNTPRPFVDGIVLAGMIATPTLAALSINAGTITAGLLQNAAGTIYIDLNATGVESFIKHPKFELQADGDAIFQGQLDIAGSQVQQNIQSVNIILRDAGVTHGMTALVETDVIAAFGYANTNQGGLGIWAFSESTAGPAIHLQGTSGSSGAAVLISGFRKSGSDRVAMTSQTILGVAPGGGSFVFDVNANGRTSLAGILDLADDVEVSERTIAVATGANNNVNTGTTTVQRLQSIGGVANITGFAGGRPGRLLMLYNFGVNPITLNNNSGGSSASNRMLLPSSIVLTQGDGVTLVYDNDTNKWRCVGIAV